MKALTIVAHPDDCIIFAYGFINHYKHLDWTICYLTYTNQDPRAQELANFWSRRGVKTIFLGYVDDYRDLESGVISFDSRLAAESIKDTIKNYNLVLTHDHRGDYGHLHHKFIHDVVVNNHTYVVTFARGGQSNVKYTVDSTAYSLDEIPLHRDVVSSFFPNGHINEYCVTHRVQNIL